MPPELRLYEDVLANDGEVSLPALPRMIFVVHGSVAAAAHGLRDGETLSGEGAVTLKAGPGGATLWRWELVPGDAVGGAAGHSLARKAVRAARNPPPGSATPAWRQRRIPGGRLRLSAPASGPGHPLPARRRHPHRHARPLGVLRARRGLVRNRPGRRVCPGRGPADAVYPRHDPAARLSWKKLGRISQWRRQGEAEVANLQDFRRHAADGGGRLSGHTGL
jgi:hypothetical protein